MTAPTTADRAASLTSSADRVELKARDAQAKADAAATPGVRADWQATADEYRSIAAARRDLAAELTR